MSEYNLALMIVGFLIGLACGVLIAIWVDI